MKAVVDMDTIKTVSSNVKKSNEELLSCSKEAIANVNDLRNVWHDDTSSKVLNKMDSSIKSIDDFYNDLNAFCDFLDKVSNSYTSLDDNFRNELIRGENDEN